MTEPQMYLDALTCNLVIIDNKGYCQPYFLNTYKTKNAKGKPMQLEVGSPSDGVQESVNDASKGADGQP